MRVIKYTCCMKSYRILVLLIFFSVIATAQSNGPGLPGDDPDVPVDGGVGFLIAAGIVFGVKKIREIKP